jgi:hypothetical protein
LQALNAASEITRKTNRNYAGWSNRCNSRVAAELAIADRLSQSPKASDELAA